MVDNQTRLPQLSILKIEILQKNIIHFTKMLAEARISNEPAII